MDNPPLTENEENSTPALPGMWDQERLQNAAEKSKANRALFTNQLFVQPDGLHLRMSFGERVEGEPFFHTAFVVPNSDALEFGQLLVAMAQAALERNIADTRQALADEEQAPIDGE